MEILNNIPVEFDLAKLLEQSHIDKNSEDAKHFEQLLEQAKRVAQPKAIYKVAYIENKGENTVNIDGVIFTSKVLRVNLDKIERVFPYVTTCGPELDKIDTAGNFMAPYWLDEIKGAALSMSGAYLHEHIQKQYKPGEMSSMAPGSGAVDIWPIEQQKQLFSLFGDVESLIDVRLTDSCLMIPNKSLSGMYFPTAIRFESCRLCARKKCQGRNAPYDPELVKKYRDE